MKKKIVILISALFLIFLYIGTIGVTNLFANLIVIDMISAEKTGETRKVYVERGYWVKEYEIKVEWYMDAPESEPTELDLYRRSSPGAYPNGNIIGSDVEAYYENRYWSWLYQSWRIYSEYRHYNWVQSGTWTIWQNILPVKYLKLFLKN